jgi:hypothetical protein
MRFELFGAITSGPNYYTNYYIKGLVGFVMQ